MVKPLLGGKETPYLYRNFPFLSFELRSSRGSEKATVAAKAELYGPQAVESEWNNLV